MQLHPDKNQIHALQALLLIFTATLFYSCSKDSLGTSPSSAVQTGKGGSLARFTIAGEYLYAVDNHFLYAYSLAKPSAPEKIYTSSLNYDIETIYPFKNFLFLGTRTGLYIYSVENPKQPVLVGEARHARSCDPVMANDSVAFVTLKGSGSCGPATSGLYIHDIKNLTSPILKTTIAINDPLGLGLQDSVLYVCCGSEGLKVYNVKDPFAPVLKETKTGSYFIDVIPYNGILVAFVKKGIVLFDISDPGNPMLVKQLDN